MAFSSSSATRSGRLSRLARTTFSVRLRFTAWRVTIISTPLVLALVAFSSHRPNINVLGLTLLSVVLVHHFLSMLGPRFSFPKILDCVLLCTECIATIPNLILYLTPIVHNTANKSNDSSVDIATIANIVLWFILILSLLLLSLFRTIDLVVAPRRSDSWKFLWERYDLAWPARKTSRKADQARAGIQTEGSLASKIILGHLYKSYFPGESGWVIYSRAILAVIFILSLLAYGFVNIVVGPLQERMMELAREHRSLSLSDQISQNFPLWGVVASIRLNYLESSIVSDIVQNFPSAISVEQLGSSRGSRACEWDPAQTSHDPTPIAGQHTIFFAGMFLCQIPGLYLYNPDVLRVQDAGLSRFNSDLLVTVNFTQLKIPGDRLGFTSRDSVQIFLATNPDVKRVMTLTAPTTLIPGVNLVGMVKMAIRRKFQFQGLSSLGIFDIYEDTVIGDMPHVYSDPLASGPVASPLILRDPNSGKSREDYQNQSVFSGFSQVGGLWTFFAGIFAAVFGTSTMRILFGLKPLAIFGLAHSFQKSKLREACNAEYPRVQQDLSALPVDRGILSLMHDHLLDVEFLSPNKSHKDDYDSNDINDTQRSDLAHENIDLNPLCTSSSEYTDSKYVP
ncbi:hypothetical protein CPB83DRAFT_887917 [Crepidotus variabilis]|uniref:Uncharacterized protein n=1 Tax=Crepidotus variabilis TaxID=179855 RepID=A0A9P6E2W4_9AGAR|nr:hypothetical protein CPB83DRAFT_887917 [Crepidotus variabilis]